jgi:hypothetical protein
MWIRKLFFSVLLLSCGWLQAQTVWPAVQSNMYPYIPFMKLVRHEQTVLLGEGTNRMARLESARLQWRNHSGMNPPNLSDLGNFDQLMTDFGNVPLPASLEIAITEAINNSPQLQKSLSEVKSSWHSLELSRSATRPKINADQRQIDGHHRLPD